MEYKSNRPAINKAIQAGIQKGLDAAAIHLQGEIKKTLSGSSPAPHSKPPGVKTGTLRRSIQVDRSRNRGKRPVVRVGTNLQYAKIHEFGGVITPTRAKALKFQLADGSWRTARRVVIPARPFIRPTHARSRKKLVSIFRGAVRRELVRVK
ncbi:MAG: HK97 gp10 family phage protein [Planctomycetota bacterium]